MLNTPGEIRSSIKLLEAKTHEHGPVKAMRAFRKLLHEEVNAGNLKLENISFRTLYEACYGREALDNLNPRYSHSEVALMEADAVNTSQFSNIIGQVSYSTVLQLFEQPGFFAQQLIPTVPATTQNFEIIPGVSMLGDGAEDVGELEEYPIVGLSEDWVTAPQKIKDGFICPISREMIWEDKTGEVMNRVNGGANSMAVTMEKEFMDTLVGATTTYRRRNNAAETTYGDSGDHSESFDNQTTEALNDYTDLEAAETLFDEMTDPHTGEPIMIAGDMELIVPTQLRKRAFRVLNAIQVGNTASDTAPVAANPFVLDQTRRYRIWSSPYVSDRSGSTTAWFVGDPRRAFEYREVWPVQVETMDRNSHAGFTRDIVFAMKVSRKGACYCKEPRYMVKSTGAA